MSNLKETLKDEKIKCGEGNDDRMEIQKYHEVCILSEEKEELKRCIAARDKALENVKQALSTSKRNHESQINDLNNLLSEKEKQVFLLYKFN